MKRKDAAYREQQVPGATRSVPGLKDKNVKKKLLWIGGVVVVLGATLAGGAWWFMSQPLYKPGNLSSHPGLEPVSYDQEGPWHVAEGIELSHFARGDGRNVLYIHGGPGVPPQGPIPAFDRLSDAYRVHYYAQRGTGDSTRPIRGFDSNNTWENIQTLVGALGMREQLADIERIRRILGDDKLIIVGHSYGGFLAALYAAERPQHVSALVLIAPAALLVMPAPHGGLFDGIRTRLPESQHAEYDAWLERYLDLGAAFSKREADLEALDRELVRYWEAAIGPLPPTAVAAEGAAGAWMARAQYFSMGQRHDYTAALTAIDAPTLIIHGADDIQSLATSEMYRDAVQDARLVSIEGGGHFMHHTHPDEVATAIRERVADAR